jgi:DNA polymerase-1
MVIDGNSILNRAFYGVRLLSNHEGLYTNGIYGFLSTYFKLMEEEAPDRIIVCFDKKEKTFRHKMYDGYKAQRKGMPDELAVQLPVLKEVLDKLGVSRCELAGFEADDLLGTISQEAETHGDTCVLVTGDKDSLQLIGEHTIVKLVVTRMGQTTTKNYDPDLFREEYGFEPHSMIDLKALMGDASDNIPGVTGIGEKTAKALIQEFQTVDAVYDNLDNPNIKPGVRKKLEAGREQAEMSRTLATIIRDVPLPLSLDALPSPQPDTEALYQLFTRLEFKNFIQKLDLQRPEEEKEKHALDIEQVQTFQQWKELELPKEISVILSQDGGLLAIAAKEKQYVFSQNDFSESDWLILLRSVFAGDFTICTHQAKELVLFLKRQWGIQTEQITFDLCIAAYLLGPTENSYELPKLASAYLQETLGEEIYNTEAAYNLFGITEEGLNSLAEAVQIVQALHPVLREKLKEQDMLALFEKIEMPLLYVLADMEDVGVKIDREQLQAYGKDLSIQAQALQEEIYDLAGQEFNIQSPKQLGEVLFEKLGLPPLKKTKTGYSTNAEVLEQLKNYHPIIGKILEYRQLTKLLSTYVEGLGKVISPNDGRIHSHFQQTVTATGRLSSTEPNLQNIPVRTELGAQLRKMFVAEPGKVLIDADYSQIELRVLAHMADDPAMIQAFLSGKDIHTATAAQVFHVPAEEVTSHMRSSAKAVNFGIVYGISDFSLAEDIGVSRKEAKAYIQSYLDTYKGVAMYMDAAKKEAKERGYVGSLFGRRRYLPELKSKNFNIRSFGERVALNTPIQATAADIIKMAMIRVFRRLKVEKRKTRLILQIHDELILEGPEEEKEDIMHLLQEEMEHAATLQVPLVADSGWGLSWQEAKG